MLAYAANRPLAGRRESSPNALLLVISAHVALLALVMSAKMDVRSRIRPAPPLIDIPVPMPPPPEASAKPAQGRPKTGPVTRPAERLPLTAQADVPADTVVAPGDDSAGAGGGATIAPPATQPARTAPVHHDPQLLTPASELKPPYPPAKLAGEEEATLRLRLTIDEQGRVTAVDPLGHAEPEFLNAARRHIIAHWRYAPARNGDQATGAAIIVTLEFRLGV